MVADTCADAKTLVRLLVDRTCWHNPLAWLAGDRCDEVEVRLVVQNCKRVFLADDRLGLRSRRKFALPAGCSVS